MALPPDVRRQAEAQVATYCATRVPSELTDEIQIAYSIRGNSITIAERRPPWNPEFGSEWSSQDVARLRYDAAKGTWSLDCATTRGWQRYDFAQPARDVGPLLRAVEEDATGIFWG